MPVYDSRGRTEDNYEYSGPAQNSDSAYGGSFTDQERKRQIFEERMRQMRGQTEAMDLQDRIGEQQLQSAYNLDRERMFHPYEHMTPDQRGVSLYGPMYGTETRSKYDPALAAGINASSDMLRSYNEYAVDDSLKQAEQTRYQELMGQLQSGQSRYGGPSPQASSGIQFSEGSAAPQPAMSSNYAASLPQPVGMGAAGVPLSTAYLNAKRGLGNGAVQPSSAGLPPVPTAGAGQAVSADMEASIQETMRKYGKTREQVIAAMRAKGMM